jgi:hypothetical protein
LKDWIFDKLFPGSQFAGVPRGPAEKKIPQITNIKATFPFLYQIVTRLSDLHFMALLASLPPWI